MSMSEPIEVPIPQYFGPRTPAEPSHVPVLNELVNEYNRGLLTQNDFRERIVDLWERDRITDGQFCEYDRMQANAYLPQSHFEKFDHFEFIYSEDE